MRILCLVLHARVALAALLLLAGCSVPAATPVAPQDAPLARAGGHAKSWMLSEAKHEDLLYVANVYTITVYSYPKGKLVGTLSDFYKPYGECVDASGDVWITDSSFSKIYEYAHGGTKPIHTLKDPNEEPYGCAVDPTTGDLAVANYSDTSAREGNVAIYHKAKGYPKSYTGYDFYYYFYLGYDPRGNLFIDGEYVSGLTVEFGELAKGSDVIQDFILPKRLAAPGGIEWDGDYVAVGDMAGGPIYEYSFSSKGPTLEGTTPLTGAGLEVGQFGIADSTVVTPNQFFSGSGVQVYPYPGGGSPTKSITNGVFYPFSSVVSPAAAR
jgi:hypothetical protein